MKRQGKNAGQDFRGLLIRGQRVPSSSKGWPSFMADCLTAVNQAQSYTAGIGCCLLIMLRDGAEI
jgi:hypothetical protein